MSKVLTIKQPWASLIVNEYKEYEFRTWKTKYRGKILIHAGLGIDKKYLEKFSEYNLEYISGAIIGEAEIVDCILVDEKFNKELLKKNKEIYGNNIGEFAFKLENIKKYEEPIYCKGKLGLWNFDKNERKEESTNIK